tara:strand:- start:47845 stop:48105 length:261 start_codon:yes stop_codon:yes gene_type:complete
MNTQQRIESTPAINVYALCNLLVEELDKMEASTHYKKTLKQNVRNLTKGIEHLDKQVAPIAGSEGLAVANIKINQLAKALNEPLIK